MCNYASAFAATTCGCFTSNDQIICRKAGSHHTKILREPPLFHFCCIAPPPRKKAENGLWRKLLKVTSCEKVTSLAWCPPRFVSTVFSFGPAAGATVWFQRRLSLIEAQTAACHFKLPPECNKSRGQKSSHHTASSARPGKPRTILFPFTGLPWCHGPGIMRTGEGERARTHARTHGHKHFADALSGERVESGLLFLPRMFTAGITRRVWLSGSFTAGPGKPRNTQIPER